MVARGRRVVTRSSQQRDGRRRPGRRAAREARRPVDGDSLRPERALRGRRMVTRRAPQRDDRRRLGRWWRAVRRSALAAGGW